MFRPKEDINIHFKSTYTIFESDSIFKLITQSIKANVLFAAFALSFLFCYDL